MHMIGDDADALSNSPSRANDSTKICVQFPAPSRLDQRLMILCSKINMIVQGSSVSMTYGLIYYGPSGLDYLFTR
jgi:hypothetical protein